MIHEQFWLGLLVPFLIVFAYVAVGWLYVGSRRLWNDHHLKFARRVDLPADRISFEQFTGESPVVTTYIESADKFRDALLLSPRLWMFTAFGYYVLIVREAAKPKKKVS